MDKLFTLDDGLPTPIDADWSPDDLTILATEIRRDEPLLVKVEIGGAWRSNRNFDTQCLSCGADHIYIGWPVDGEWFIRWKCPTCGNESMTMYPRFRSPMPVAPFGGQQKRATANRRRKSGY